LAVRELEARLNEVLGRTAQLEARLVEVEAENARLRAEKRPDVEQLLARTAQLEARVFELETENAKLRAENRRFKRQDRKLTDENRHLRREVRRLGGRVQPPSNTKAPSEPPAKAKKGGDAGDETGEEQEPRGERKKRGAQPGHAPQNRELLPEDKVDRFEDVKPSKCDRCGARLPGKGWVFHRHQVTEAPEPRAETVEWRLHGENCTCGAVTLAQLPEGVPRGNFGPRLQALVGVATGAHRLSKRTVQELLHDWFGIPMSLGSVTACERAVSEALAAPHAEALAHVKQQPVKQADETGWIEGLRKVYLWTIVTPLVSVFVIAYGRTKDLARSMLGPGGILVSDRLASYYFWPSWLHQFCWAHLERRFAEFLLSDESSHKVGAQLLVQVRHMWEFWYRVRDGTQSRRSFKRSMAPIRRSVKSLLQEGAACTDPEVAGTCQELLDHEASLWTFVRHEGVEPTNNASERALRHGVLYRRACFGTQSERGSRFVERMLTTRATLRAQSRNVMAFVVAACQARLAGTAAPSLLPLAKCANAA